EYPPKDGYENNRQLNIIARAILIYKELVRLWKEIGYHEVCKDVNDLVLQGIILPPSQPIGWTKPDVKTVKERHSELIDLEIKKELQDNFLPICLRETLNLNCKLKVKTYRISSKYLPETRESEFQT
ncbi:8466_t:CDS:2, partial [Scutellospora calospora]